jgi:hypothetical protein
MRFYADIQMYDYEFISGWWFRFMVFSATFNNNSVISWRSVLLVEETSPDDDNNF